MPKPRRETADGTAGLLAPLGTLVALGLPFFVLTLASAEATRELKVAAQAAGAVLVLLGLTSTRPGSAAAPRPAARLARLALAAFLALFAVSFASGALRGRELLDALPLLPALALFAWGATRSGVATSRRALAFLVACGAATGVLAALQRFAGLFRLPVEAPEPRFLATALIGNPGDVGASLVIPALLAAASFLRGERRVASALALAACGAGLAAAATLAPLAAFLAGAALLVALDLRRRLLPAFGAATVLLALLAGSGTLRRAAEKLSSGDVSTLTTQRDIGVLAALESIRERPLLGTGPGGFASDFVRARLAAEERVGRRLVHASTSAHFDNAHCDPLTVAAETGAPAALAAAVALGALLVGLLSAARAERSAPGADDPPAESLLSPLAAVVVLSLANFPVQIVPVSGPFALLAGLAFARAGGCLPALSPRRARPLLVVAALLLAAGASLRAAGGLALARSEESLRLSQVPLAPRGELLSAALGDARRAVALRPRHAPSLLALGAARSASADLDGATSAMARSLALEERAETLLNLGRIALARGDSATARELFVRAVWVFPRLAEAIPPAGDPAGVADDVRRLEAALPSGGAPPPLPGAFRRR